MNAVDWNDANLEILVTGWMQGYSMTHIAKMIPGATRNAVAGKIHRMHMKRRRDDWDRPPDAPAAKERTA